MPGFVAQAYEGRLLSFPQLPVQSIMAVWGGETGVLHAKT